jgi:uncharacterized protein YcbX
MALIDSPCERCGFDTGDSERGRHASEWYCFQALHRAAVEEVKAKIAGAANIVASQQGAQGTPETERLADAFKAFSETVLLMT